jgi:hypothetical protein
MGKPTTANQWYFPVEKIDREEGTWGTETSKYPEEKRIFP